MPSVSEAAERMRSGGGGYVIGSLDGMGCGVCSSSGGVKRRDATIMGRMSENSRAREALPITRGHRLYKRVCRVLSCMR